MTEEDIALSMMALDAKCESLSLSSADEHPLKALSEENLTIISHFTGETYSQGTASDWEPISTHYGSVYDDDVMDVDRRRNDFFQSQLEHLAKLHQIYQPAAGSAGIGTLHPTPLSALTTSQIGSFKVNFNSFKS